MSKKYFIYAVGYYDNDSSKTYEIDCTITTKKFVLNEIRESLKERAHNNGYKVSKITIKSVCKIED